MKSHGSLWRDFSALHRPCATSARPAPSSRESPGGQNLAAAGLRQTRGLATPVTRENGILVFDQAFVRHDIIRWSTFSRPKSRGGTVVVQVLMLRT